MAADEPDYDPERCSPCRGTGTVISNHGGSPKDVTCPWCGGTGRRRPGINAQDPEGSAATDAS
jgi:DnaJ-class molecular chaperone